MDNQLNNSTIIKSTNHQIIKSTNHQFINSTPHPFNKEIVAFNRLNPPRFTGEFLNN